MGEGLEIESKYLVLEPKSREYVKSVLEELGFKTIGEYIEEDTYYNHPCRDFHETDEALRIRVRRSGGGVVSSRITYKGRKIYVGNIKRRIEYETTIGDPGVIENILRSLGFRKVAKLVKRRVVLRRDNVEVTLDLFMGKLYVEIEAEPDIINEVAELLRSRDIVLKPIRETYLEIYLRSVGV